MHSDREYLLALERGGHADIPMKTNAPGTIAWRGQEIATYSMGTPTIAPLAYIHFPRGAAEDYAQKHARLSEALAAHQGARRWLHLVVVPLGLLQLLLGLLLLVGNPDREVILGALLVGAGILGVLAWMRVKTNGIGRARADIEALERAGGRIGPVLLTGIPADCPALRAALNLVTPVSLDRLIEHGDTGVADVLREMRRQEMDKARDMEAARLRERRESVQEWEREVSEEARAIRAEGDVERGGGHGVGGHCEPKWREETHD